MWIITVYSKENTTLFEFDTEEEARNAFKKMTGNKILSEIVYFNDPCFTKITVWGLYTTKTEVVTQISQ